jgi:DNA-binding response OmpR family regulator
MDREIARHAIELGAFDYLPKPFYVEDLEERIVAFLGTEEYRRIPWSKKLTT